MDLKNYIKQNKVFFSFTLLVFAWLALLVVFSLTLTRETKFYNYLAKEYVSSDYNAKIPLLRYLIEPIVAIAFYLTFEDYYIVIAFLVGYVTCRIVYSALKTKNAIKSEKFSLLTFLLRDVMWFAAKVCLITLLVLLVYYLSSVLFVGGEFAGHGMFYLLEVLIWLGLTALAIKLAFIFYKYIVPELRFNYQERVENIRFKSKTLTGVKKELMYLLGFVFLFLSATVVLKMTVFPTYIIEPEDKKKGEILMDFHCHTTESDGWLTPSERVMWYIQHGIDAAVFSDHDTPEGAIKAKKFVEANDLDFTVILGQEFSAGNHLNIYGLKERIIPEEKEYEGGPKSMSIKEMIKYVKEEGGYVTVNHYDREADHAPYTLEEYRDMGVDGFEIINKKDLQSKEVRNFCLENNLICLSGSDMHYNHELYSFVKLKLNDPDDISVDTIFESLKNNTHQTVLIEKHPERVQFDGLFADLVEFEQFANYLMNLDSWQYLSWISWSLGGYLLIGFVYSRIKKIDIQELKDKIL